MCVGVFAPFLDTRVYLWPDSFICRFEVYVLLTACLHKHTHTHTILTIIMSVTAFLFFSLSILNTAWLSSSYQGLLLVLFSQRSHQSLVSEREKDQPNNKRHWNLFFHKHVLLWKERRKKNSFPKGFILKGNRCLANRAVPYDTQMCNQMNHKNM